MTSACCNFPGLTFTLVLIPPYRRGLPRTCLACPIPGSCLCLGDLPGQYDTLDTLSYGMYDAVNSARLGSITVQLDQIYFQQQNQLAVSVTLNPGLYFARSATNYTLQLGASRTPLLAATGCPDSSVFTTKLKTRPTSSSVQPYSQVDIAGLAPNCSHPAQQKEPPTILALFAKVMVTTTTVRWGLHCRVHGEVGSCALVLDLGLDTIGGRVRTGGCCCCACCG